MELYKKSLFLSFNNRVSFIVYNISREIFSLMLPIHVFIQMNHTESQAYESLFRRRNYHSKLNSSWQWLLNANVKMK